MHLSLLLTRFIDRQLRCSNLKLQPMIYSISRVVISRQALISRFSLSRLDSRSEAVGIGVFTHVVFQRKTNFEMSAKILTVLNN